MKYGIWITAQRKDDGTVIREACFNDIFQVPFFDTAEKAEAYIYSKDMPILADSGGGVIYILKVHKHPK